MGYHVGGSEPFISPTRSHQRIHGRHAAVGSFPSTHLHKYRLCARCTARGLGIMIQIRPPLMNNILVSWSYGASEAKFPGRQPDRENDLNYYRTTCSTCHSVWLLLSCCPFLRIPKAHKIWIGIYKISCINSVFFACYSIAGLHNGSHYVLILCSKEYMIVAGLIQSYLLARRMF